MWSLWLAKSSIIRFQLPLHILFTNQHSSHPFANSTLSRRLLHLQSLLHLLTSTSITLKCNRTHVLPKHFFGCWSSDANSANIFSNNFASCAIATTQANRFFSSSAPFIFVSIARFWWQTSAIPSTSSSQPSPSPSSSFPVLVRTLYSPPLRWAPFGPFCQS